MHSRTSTAHARCPDWCNTLGVLGEGKPVSGHQVTRRHFKERNDATSSPHPPSPPPPPHKMQTKHSVSWSGVEYEGTALLRIKMDVVAHKSALGGARNFALFQVGAHGAHLFARIFDATVQDVHGGGRRSRVPRDGVG